MTIILLTIVVFFTLAMLFYKEIRKYHYVIYAISGLIALVLEESNIISLGYVPFGIFLIVMFTGAMDRGVIRKRLSYVRAEYSVIGFVFLLPHALGYLFHFIEEYFILEWPISFLPGLIATLVFVPLIITSFTFIRSKMTYKEWKFLHRFAYFGYAMMFLHLILINNERQLMYIIIVVVYTTLRIPDVIRYYKKSILKKNMVK